MNIVIIDDGINDECFFINPIKAHIRVNNGGDISTYKPSDVSSKSHGSICAAILSAYSPKCTITSIQLYCSDGKSSIYPEQLYAALRYCCSLSAQVIHLSLGITDVSVYYDLLASINMLYMSGKIIVAASNIDGTITLPACYANVIGVMHSSLSRAEKYVKVNGYANKIDILVNSKEKLQTKDGSAYIVEGQSSFAVPYICGMILNKCSQHGYNQLGIKLQFSRKCEKSMDWIINPTVFILTKNRIAFNADAFIFDKCTVLPVICSNLDLGMAYISNYLNAHSDIAEIVVTCTDKSYESEALTRETTYMTENSLSNKDVALCMECSCLEDLIEKAAIPRSFILKDYCSMQLPFFSTRSLIIELEHINALCNERLFEIIDSKAHDTLIFTYRPLEVLYGLEYISDKLLEHEEEKLAYMKTMAYTIGFRKIVVLV